MKHTMYTFRLHRTGVILIALGALLVAALLVVGGCMVGVWRTESRAAAGAGATAGAGPEAGPPPGGAGAPAPRAAGAGGAGGGADAGAGAEAGAGAAMPAGTMAPAAAGERFTLRVGAFNQQEEAKALADALTGRGYQPSIVEVRASTGSTVFTVVVGTYTTRWEARGAAAELSRRERREVVVVPAP